MRQLFIRYSPRHCSKATVVTPGTTRNRTGFHTICKRCFTIAFILHNLTQYGTLLCKLSTAFSSKENPSTPNLQTKSRSQIGTLLFQSCQNPPSLFSPSYFVRFDTSSRKPTFSRSLSEPSAEVRQRQSAGGPSTQKKEKTTRKSFTEDLHNNGVHLVPCSYCCSFAARFQLARSHEICAAASL